MKITIGLPVRNQIRYVRKCIDSIINNTHVSYRLIIVDDNSKNKNYLNEVRKKVPKNKLEIIENDKQLGFPETCNLIFQNVRTEYVSIVTSDCIVPSDWLKPLLASMEKHKKLGVVGPMTSWCSGKQCIQGLLKIRDKMTMDDINEVFTMRQRLFEGKMKFLDTIMGFCTLFRMKALRDVKENGYYLDNRFFPGSGEDNDICIRLRLKKWLVGIALNSYVHHYGNRTFRAEYKIEGVRKIWNKGKDKTMKKYPGMLVWQDNPTLINGEYYGRKS